MPFIVSPEGKVLAQSGAIMKYICKQSGNIARILLISLTGEGLVLDGDAYLDTIEHINTDTSGTSKIVCMIQQKEKKTVHNKQMSL